MSDAKMFVCKKCKKEFFPTAQQKQRYATGSNVFCSGPCARAHWGQWQIRPFTSDAMVVKGKQDGYIHGDRSRQERLNSGD